ncbi:MAG TPA: 4-hydroxybenzoate octaprenyltransferase [Verrucomicrobiae bacterium]|nr:4-hydroxybenzoate octaprenyltransferase [Verrucomicrobiae bacterium]
MANTRQTHAKAELRTDIPRGSWVDRWLPAQARPYARLMRLDRPIGTWLLLFPCWWGLTLARPPDTVESAVAILLFAIGALVKRGAGCTYNDIVDRDFDAKVARTALRPIPSGQVSVRAAVVFLAAQLFVGLIILLQFNWFTVWLGVASLTLVFTYPLMKRITYWPQAFLGLTFNWGILMGWSAVFGSIGWQTLLLYAGGVAWTLHYDTIYAHQDKEDDALIGVKSTALKFGTATKPWLCLFSAVALLLFGMSFALNEMHWAVWVGLAAVALHLAWQIRSVDLNDAADCLEKFRANRWIGWLLLCGIVIGNTLLGTGTKLINANF